MRLPAAAAGITLSPEILEEITAIYERGFYVQAYERAKAVGPLLQWAGTPARVMAGRLAMNLGGTKLGCFLHLRTWADDRTDPVAAVFCGYSIFGRRGPLATWRFLQRLPAFPKATPSAEADLLALHARVLASFRDFTAAEDCLKRAADLSAHEAWIWCERASIRESEDRYPEALEAVQRALELRPWYRPALQQAAQSLQLLNRDAEAASLLEEGLQHCESPDCAVQLSVIHEELGAFEEAIRAWEKVRAWRPLADEETTRGWHGRMAELHYLAGRRQTAAEHAAQAGDEEPMRRFAERLAAETESRRVILPVGFVRQHHLTCAPATLSAIAGFLGQPVDHLALAREITYDGTPDHIERGWAEKSGFVAREFRVTWEISVALLERGIPFTLTTTETTSAHLQAVVGFDSLKETLVVRDPYLRWQREFIARPLLENQAPFGPRGMVLLPAAEAARLDGLDLPDAPFYDRFYEIRTALARHDRPGAEAGLTAIEALDPQHRLTWLARRELAAYDAHPQRLLAASEALLGQFPECGFFLMGKAIALRECARPAEHIEFLRELAHREVDPALVRLWASELARHAPQRAIARRHLRRILRLQSQAPENLAAFANMLWDDREHGDATVLYRFAACLRDTVNSFSQSYFLAARHLRQGEMALAWLRARAARHGALSSQPAQILFWALEILDRSEEAIATLEEALNVRTADADLLLFATDAFARLGRFERAAELLRRAEARSARSAWLRSAANLATIQRDLPRARECWSEVLEREPLAQDAQVQTSQLIGELEGRAAAIAAIDAGLARFPHYLPLHRLRIEWARGEGPAAWEQAIRGALELADDDPWLRRELALALNEQRRFEPALAETDAAILQEPQNPTSHSIRGFILLNAERKAEGCEALRQALRLGIDSRDAIVELANAAGSVEENLAAAEFVHAELVRQVVFGDGLLAFRDVFYPTLDPERLLGMLREAHAARPDLWHAWSALTRQLADMERTTEALETAQRSVERFPLLPGAWNDLALVRRLRGERKAEAEALAHALQINPGWTPAALQLSTASESLSDFDAARHALEKAVAAAPLDPSAHQALAAFLWRRGEKEAAIERAIAAARTSPGFDAPWEALAEWPAQIGQPDRAVAVARELTELRPGEARSWYRLAQTLPGTELPEILTALDRTTELSPRFVEAHDLRAWRLASAGRFDEAAAACAPAAFGNDVPPQLRGRAAWIEAMRGHLPQAVEMMRAVTKAAPSYTWAWSLLSEWLYQLGREKESLQAAMELVRLAPRSAVSLGYLANAQLRAGEKAEARKSLQRAFQLDRAYGFAGYNLFRLELDARDFAAARETLGLLQQHLPGAETEGARVRLVAREGNGNEALEILRRLCASTEENAPTVLREVTEEATRSHLLGKIQSLFSELVNVPGTHPEVGALWVEREAVRTNWGNLARVEKLDPNSPMGHRIHIALLTAYGGAGRTKDVRRLIARHRESLHADPRAWAQGGYALTACSEWKAMVDWMAGWKERPEVEPWMLTNLAQSLYHLGRDAEAREVSRHAVTIRGDQTTGQHHAWLALDDAGEGRIDSAAEHLAAIDPQNPSSVAQAARVLASAVVRVHRAPKDQRRAEFRTLKTSLQNSQYLSLFPTPQLCNLSRRAVATMAAAAGARPFHLGPRFQMGGRAWLPFIPIVVILLSAVIRNIEPPAPALPPLPPRSRPTPSTPAGYPQPTSIEEIERYLSTHPPPRPTPAPTPPPARTILIAPPALQSQEILIRRVATPPPATPPGAER